MRAPADILASLRAETASKADGPLARLAALIVDDVLAAPVAQLVDPARFAEALREGIQAMTASDAAATHVTTRIAEALGALMMQKGPVGEQVPEPWLVAARAIATGPFTPKRAAIVRLLDREPVRQMLKAQVAETLATFGRKATSPDSPLARGIGGLGKLAFGQRPSPLGSIANALSNEVERQVDKRANEFAGTAVEGILQGIADQMSDPQRAKEQAALRLGVLEGFLEMTGVELVDMARGPAIAHVETVRRALQAWAADEAFVADVSTKAADLISKETKRPLGDLLADLSLKDVVRSHAVALVKERLAHLVAGDAFGHWLEALLTNS